LVLAAGCKPSPHRPDAGPPWWKPAPGEAADWDIQLAATTAAPFNISAQHAMYTFNLWDVVPAATTLDYGDGAPLMVPAGALPTAITDLHTRATPAMVVCHFGGGSIRLDDPDAKKFPGYAGGNPPNRPDPVAAGSVIGWSTTPTDANERFIDIHPAARTTVAALIDKRIELAKTIGCDAVAVKDTDLPAYQSASDIGHGFAFVQLGEYLGWTEELSTRAHELILSIGVRNKSPLGADSLAATYDWTMVDRCAERFLADCGGARPFLNLRKATFAIEYDKTEDGDPNDASALATLCGDLQRAGIESGIVKSAALDSAYYMRCM